MAMAVHTTSIPATPDVVIIGAGAVGLWCALKARQRGLHTVVVEKGRIGQGASGGVLGALMPHRPVQWTDTKAFQLAALMSLETEIADLEAATERSCDYARCGRVMPISSQSSLAEHEQWQQGAKAAWPASSPSGQRVSWDMVHGSQDPSWPALKPGFAACSYDTLSARINPRKLLVALAACIEPEVAVVENCPVEGFSGDGEVVLADGRRLSAGRIIMAAGHESFAMLQPALQCEPGWGVKGQAVLLRPQGRCFDGMPIIYNRGTYVIAHEGGLVAVGSTSSAGLCQMPMSMRLVSQSTRSAGRRPVSGAWPIQT